MHHYSSAPHHRQFKMTITNSFGGCWMEGAIDSGSATGGVGPTKK